MNSFLKSFITLLLAVCGLTPVLAEDFVTLHSESAGTLKLTREALTASHLKVSGKINASDFATLKTVTMEVTEILDLSECIIEACTGKGSFSSMDKWIVGSYDHMKHEANALPVHAFTLTADNSLSMWYYGSKSLKKIILPATLETFAPGVFTKMEALTELEVPESSTTIRCINNVVYDYNLTKVVGLPPLYPEILRLPSSVTTVADHAMSNLVLRGIEIEGSATVDFGVQEELKVGYVLTPAPEAYADIFPAGTDITSEMPEAVLTDVEPGTLMNQLGNAGWRNNTVRRLKVSGTLNEDDMNGILALPNLHYLDLGESEYTGGNIAISDSKICEMKLPHCVDRNNLTIYDCPYLGGTLDVPEGVVGLNVSCLYLTELTCPSTLWDLSGYSSNCLEKVDFSKCTGLSKIGYYDNLQRLHTVILPEGLKYLDISAPVENIELPESLEELGAGGWKVETLMLPVSTKKASVDMMLNLHTLDVSKAEQLTSFGLSRCPLITEIDLRYNPLKEFGGLHFDDVDEYFAQQEPDVETRIVVINPYKQSSFIPSSIVSLQLPSTLECFSGLENCDLLEELDLYRCTKLKELNLDAIQNLKTLKLPMGMEQVQIGSQCAALTNIYSASCETIPELSIAEELPISNMTVHVPIGCRGGYIMAPAWGECQDVVEEGYSVLVNSDLDGVPVIGSGLYNVGSTVQISAPESIGDLDFSHWMREGSEKTESNATTSFVPAGHTTVTASYAKKPVEYRKELLFSFSASETTDLSFTLFMDEKSDVEIHSGGQIIEEMQKVNDVDVTLHLQPGTNEFSVVCGQIGSIGLSGVAVVDDDYNVKIPDIKLEKLQIEHPLSVHQIDMNYTQTESIDLSPYKNLRDLYVHENHLSSLDLSANVMLEWLYCERNQLSSLDVSACKSLEHLSCYENQLTALDVSACTLLKRLDCDDNQLSDLDATSCVLLEELYCSYNQLTKLEIPEIALTTLYCHGNRIKELIFDDSQIKNLSIEDNCFAFSQVNMNRYNAMLNGSSAALDYKIERNLYKNDVLDLSHEVTSLDGMPVSISINEENVESGKTTFTEGGYYELMMRCEAMPDVYFYSNFEVSDNPDGIERLPLDGIQIDNKPGTLQISALKEETKVVLYTVDGVVVAESHGKDMQMNVPHTGLYVLKLTGTTGRFATIKIQCKK